MTVSSPETALLRHVLAWDFEKMTASSMNERKARNHTDGQEHHDQRRCLSAEEYSQRFSFLLLEEARAQLVQVREGLPSSSQASGSQMTDAANQFGSHLALARQVEDNGGGFRMVKVAVDGDSTKAYKEGDLIQCVPACPEGSTTQPDSDARALALVTRREGQSSLWLKLYIGLFQPVRGYAGRHRDAVLARLQEGPSAWTIRRVWSLSTTAREWHAIHAVRTLPFCPIILDPQRQLGPPWMKQPFRAPRPLANRLKSILNSDQLDFLQRSLEFSGVLLLQGPPGTGKTRTVLALLSLLLHAAPGSCGKGSSLSVADSRSPPCAAERPRQWLKCPWLAGRSREDVRERPDDGSELDQPAVVGKRARRGAHCLVCAPSNAAVDEVAERVLEKGLMDEEGENYVPNCARIGVKCRASVRGIAVEDQEGERSSGVALDNASVVFSTLSYSGSVSFSRAARPFDAVIVDEATQATEPATLVPSLHGCKQLILVGDPSQLPATVISPSAREGGLAVSLFERLRRSGYPCDMLREQHRMHPEIRRFPSKEFYDGELGDSQGLAQARQAEWHSYRLFCPFLLIDVLTGVQEHGGMSSLCNQVEARVAAEAAATFWRSFPDAAKRGSLAIITPYKAQVELIKRLLTDKAGSLEAEQTDVSTIDGFQGRETEVVLFSVVRSPQSSGSIGFMADDRRMNVALTRARSSLLVLGHSGALADYEPWRRLVSNAQRRSCYDCVSEGSVRLGLPCLTPPIQLLPTEKLTIERCRESAEGVVARLGSERPPQPGPESLDDDEVRLSTKRARHSSRLPHKAPRVHRYA